MGTKVNRMLTLCVKRDRGSLVFLTTCDSVSLWTKKKFLNCLPMAVDLSLIGLQDRIHSTILYLSLHILDLFHMDLIKTFSNSSLSPIVSLFFKTFIEYGLDPIDLLPSFFKFLYFYFGTLHMVLIFVKSQLVLI